VKLLILGALGLTLAGCATVTRGTTDQVNVLSEPSGAQAISSTGLICPMTPCTWEISSKIEFAVTVSKQGYQTQQVQVASQLAGAGAAGFAGNALLGGLIGMGVDASTGATLEHVPNPVIVTLQPLNAGRRAKPVRKKASSVPQG